MQSYKTGFQASSFLTVCLLLICCGCFRTETAISEFKNGNYSAAIASEPDFANAYYQRGKSWLKKGEYDQAIADFRRAISLDQKLERLNRVLLRVEPNRAVVHADLALACIDQGDIDVAIAECNQAIQLEPNHYYAYFVRGVCYSNQEDDQQAIEDYSDAVRLHPHHASVFFWRAKSYANQGRWQQAIDGFTRSLELDSNNLNALIHRGCAYLDSANHDAAIADFSVARVRDSTNTSLLMALSHAYQSKQDYDTAISCLEEGIKLATKDPHFRNNLAWLLATCPDEEIRDGRRAIAEATRACELGEWKQPYFLGTLAAGYAETEQFEEAVKWQKKALTFQDKVDANDLAKMQKRLESYQQYLRYEEKYD